MPSKLEHALRLVMEGFYIFRLSPGTKIPIADVSWPKDSTKDKETIKKWFKENPNYNIGIDTGKSGLVVLDIDVKHGKKGDEWYAFQEEIGNIWPETFKVQTPSLGTHYFFKSPFGVNYASSSGTLGNGVDIKATGGYVVGAGSTLDEYGGAEYKIIHNCLLEEVPEWFGKLLEAKRTPQENKGKILSSDAEIDIERAKDYLINTAPPAVQGDAGDHTTFKVAARVREFGVSRETAFDLMAEFYNPRCEPEWDLEDLETKIRNAYTYAQSPQGADSFPIEFTPVVIQERPKTIWLPEHDDSVFGSIKPREWVLGNIIIRKKLSLLVAPPGMGKSTLTINLALSKASGKNITGFDARGKGVVAIHNQEDEMDELNRRLEAAMMQHGIEKHELKENGKSRLLLGSGEQKMFKIAKKNTNGILAPTDMQSFTERLIEARVDMLVVDPFSETYEGDENSNQDVLQVGMMYRSMAQAANCGLLLCHHSKKPQGSSSEGFAGEMNSSRGASSLLGVARVVLTLDSMSDKDGKLYGIKNEERYKYIRLDNAKANLSLSRSGALWYEKHSQKIGFAFGETEGEEIGTLATVSLTEQRVGKDTALYAFLCKIEEIFIGENTVKSTIPNIVAKLAEYAEYANEKPNTLSQRIRRILNDGPMPTANGSLKMIEEKIGTAPNPRHFITYKPTAKS